MRDEIATRFELTNAANKGPFSSYSSPYFDFDTVYVSQSITRECPGTFLFSLEKSVAALLQASKPNSKPHSCRSGDRLRGSSLDSSALVLDGTVQLILTDPLDSGCRIKRPKNSAQPSS